MKHHLLQACALVAVLAIAAPAAAADVSLAIPAGDLEAALTAFSRATGVEVMSDPAQTRGRRTPGVHGRMSAEEGLRRLLAGADLKFELRDGAALITPAARAAQPPRAPVAADASAQVEVLVVTGQRRAQLSAAALKREADAVVDVVSSDDVQRLPDLTVVNALRRIPGVSVLPVSDNEHPRDEAISPVLRGLNQAYNNVTVNGLPIASTGTPLSGSGNAGRGVRLDILPTSFVSDIVVAKTFTADLDPNAVGGSIDLRTRSAFDFGGRPFLVLDVGGAYTSDKGEPQAQDDFGLRASATGGFTFGAERQFGLVVSANYQRQESATDAHMTSDSTFYNVYTPAGTRVTDGGLGNGYLVPQQDKYWYNQNDRERWSVTGKLEGRFGDTIELSAMLGHYSFVDAYQRNEVIINGRNALVRDQTATTGRYTAASVEVGFRDGSTDSTTDIAQAQLKWRPTETSELTLRAGASRAQSKEPLAMVKYTAGADRFGVVGGLPQMAFTYDASDFHYSFNLDNPEAYRNLSLYRADYWRNVDRRIEAKVDSLDLNYQGNFSRNATGFGYSVGGQVTRSRMSYGFGRAQYKPAGGDFNLADVGQLSGVRLPFQQQGLHLITIDPALAWRKIAPPGSVTEADSVATNNQDNFEHEETTVGLYAMGRYATDNASLILGLRHDATDQETASRLLVGRNWEPFKTSSSYKDLLPFALAAYEFTPDLRLRAAFSQTLGRPSYESYAARSSISFESESDRGKPNALNVSVSLGNPDIQPRLSSNYDLSLEWYPPNDRGGVVAVGAFYKDIKDEIYDGTSQGYTFEGVTYVNAVVRRPGNAKGARIAGLEAQATFNSLEFVHPRLADFGVSANFSVLSGEIEVPLAGGRDRRIGGLVGQPKKIANLAAFYTRGPFELRAAWNWTDQALRAITPDIEWQDVYWDARSQVDLQARYAIRPNLTLVAEVSNLTRARMDSVTGPGRDRLKDSYSTPRTVWLSLNWTPNF
jgi:TonB-dependent receptor